MVADVPGDGVLQPAGRAALAGGRRAAACDSLRGAYRSRWHCPARAALRNPHQGDSGVAKKGALLFTAMNCDGCHGGEGSGWVGPNLADGRWRYGGADAEVFNSIYYGRPKGMPAFGGLLDAEGVWTLVTYLRSLPVPGDVPTESWERP